jgi:hypothetical protein
MAAGGVSQHHDRVGCEASGPHFSFNLDIAGSAYGLNALGGRYASPTM